MKVYQNVLSFLFLLSPPYKKEGGKKEKGLYILAYFVIHLGIHIVKTVEETKKFYNLMDENPCATRCIMKKLGRKKKSCP